MARGGVLAPNHEYHYQRQQDAYSSDVGCRLWSACLTCPLPICDLEVPFSTQLKKYRDLLIIDLWVLGAEPDEIGEIINTDRTAVNGVISRRKKLMPDRELYLNNPYFKALKEALKCQVE